MTTSAAVDIAGLDAVAQAGLVRRGEVTAAELVGWAIERIEDLNPIPNAVITPMYEQALAAAAMNPSTDRLAGVPYLVKDLIAEVAGVPFASPQARKPASPQARKPASPQGRNRRSSHAPTGAGRAASGQRSIRPGSTSFRHPQAQRRRMMSRCQRRIVSGVTSSHSRGGTLSASRRAGSRAGPGPPSSVSGGAAGTVAGRRAGGAGSRSLRAATPPPAGTAAATRPSGSGGRRTAGT
jgi:hypothetical protein